MRLQWIRENIFFVQWPKRDLGNVDAADAIDRVRDFAAWVGLMPRLFSTGDLVRAIEAEIDKLHSKIGQLVVERDFLKCAWDR